MYAWLSEAVSGYDPAEIVGLGLELDASFSPQIDHPGVERYSRTWGKGFVPLGTSELGWFTA